MQASLDGGPPETVATAAAAGSPRAAIDDAGDALIAFGSRRGRVLVATRVAGAAWARAREIRGPLASSERNEVGEEYVDQAREISVQAVLAPDGRAVVAWDSRGHCCRTAGGRGGHVSGAWSAPVCRRRPSGCSPGGRSASTRAGRRGSFGTSSRTTRASSRCPAAPVLVADAAAPPPTARPGGDRHAPGASAGDACRVSCAGACRCGCSEACGVRLEVGGFSRVRSRSPPAARSSSGVRCRRAREPSVRNRALPRAPDGHRPRRQRRAARVDAARARHRRPICAASRSRPTTTSRHDDAAATGASAARQLDHRRARRRLTEQRVTIRRGPGAARSAAPATARSRTSRAVPPHLRRARHPALPRRPEPATS